MQGTMQVALLPGNSTVELQNFPIPQPGHGEVLIKKKFQPHEIWLREDFNV